MGRKRIWLWLLTKRLYKKPAYLALLALIPVLLLLFGYIAGQDSGMITVALAGEAYDPTAQQVMDGLEASPSMIRFVRTKTAAEAENMVRYGKADAAWIFRADMTELAEQFVEDPGAHNALVQVVQREDSVMLRVAREKLSAALFSCCSRVLYLKTARENGVQLSEAQLLEKYGAASPGTALFDFSQAGGATEEVYLTLPVRGLLAVVLALCGLAAAMFDQQDRRLGTFSWVSLRRRGLVELGCQVVSVGNVSLVTLLGLLLTGMGGHWLWELLTHGLYCLCVAGFAMVLRRLCPGEKTLAALLPVLVVAMVAICPVFFQVPQLRPVQLLLPPTYYIQGVHQPAYLGYMTVYSILCLGFCGLWDRLRQR